MKRNTRKANRAKGFPGGTRGKEPACQCRRCKRRRFNTWVERIPWRGAQQPTPVFLPGESHSEAWRATSPWGGKESDMTEEKRLNTHMQTAGKNYLHSSAALTLSTPTTILNIRACYYHPIFHMGKLRHRAVQLLVWGHTGSKQQSWDLNSGILGPGSMLLTIRPFTEVIGPASQASRVRCMVDGGAQAGMEWPGEEQLGGCE